MRLATIHADEGTQAVGVDLSQDEPRFVRLRDEDLGSRPSMIDILSEPDGLHRAESAFNAGRAAGDFVEGRLAAPVPLPGKVLCIGLNYRDHAVETGAEIPSEPVCFVKFSSCVIGPGDPIVLPRVSSKVDFEAELVVVIGKRGKHISKESAFEHVAGYTIGHDVSARDWQKGRPGGQWTLGKNPDSFAPLGPYLVTPDEVGDPHALDVTLSLNGQTMQSGSTKEFIFGIDELIAHVSQLITLEPGDVIFTGTPPGVGDARTPPVYLQGGDHVEISIDDLGTLSNPVVAEPD
ncbi:fumarylacetoacetate hydrolase family protein [Stratiformator vulcanicus]|uniref:Ureidoglycolate lyase n=1 Tax=Stratiformator vulcanicus TaxID=2527980 RepID=A0A517QZV9_9PLAN|nr:fumarylacetoacetate hydrolase family protein [Stratiformator vulcanicus]QDT37171.1 Ureidoglycolate lyase [Stratiformator vulcanicus]